MLNFFPQNIASSANGAWQTLANQLLIIKYTIILV